MYDSEGKGVKPEEILPHPSPLTPPPPKAIGLLGGTFDPIHLGHLRLAEELAETLQLTQVRFIPAGQPPHRKQPRASASQRLEMVRRAIAGNPRFMLDEREIHRHAPSYSVDTLISLRAEWPHETPLILFMGTDAFMGLTRWHRWETLLSLAHLAIAWRPGFPEADIERQCPAALSGLLARHRSHDPAVLQRTPAGCVFLHPVTQLDISASQIRASARHGRSLRYLVPDPVLDYLNENRLYD